MELTGLLLMTLPYSTSHYIFTKMVPSIPREHSVAFTLVGKVQVLDSELLSNWLFITFLFMC